MARFGQDGHVNEDISLVPTENIPDHQMLCGGFPCQDYSVASTLNNSHGILGKKGVLWWQIERICREKGENAAEILFLENVDRLLQSPASQRGRDFALMLQSLSDLHYIVEWRIINAADYGMPQRRRRTYILAYKEGSTITGSIHDEDDWILSDGVFAQTFPCVNTDKNGTEEKINSFVIKSRRNENLATVSESFNKNNSLRPFSNAGIMRDGKVWTCKVEPSYDGQFTTLGDILAKGARFT